MYNITESPVFMFTVKIKLFHKFQYKVKWAP